MFLAYAYVGKTKRLFQKFNYFRRIRFIAHVFQGISRLIQLCPVLCGCYLVLLKLCPKPRGILVMPLDLL